MRKAIVAATLVGLASVACASGSDVGEEEGSLKQRLNGWMFGSYCQGDFENGWQNSLEPWAWNTCGYFNDRLDDTDWKMFYWNMHGAKTAFEDANDQNKVETVDLLFTMTHGGADTDTSVAAMWDDGVYHLTKNSYWGDEAHGLSLWASYACSTLKIDANTWTRWNRLMKGGMRAVAGSHDLLWADPSEYIGEAFAEELQAGTSWRYAWRNAISDPDWDQDGMVMTSGNSSSDCSSRRSGMNWANFANYVRRVNANMANLCWTSWDNL
jgi:hypothetical protein